MEIRLVLFCFAFLDTSMSEKSSEMKRKCEENLKYINKYTEEYDINFAMQLSNSGEIYGYVVGFKFSGPIKNLQAYNQRISYKISKNLWFVAKNYPTPIDVVQFDIKIHLEDPVVIDEIYLNGELICQRLPEEIISPGEKDQLTPSLVVVFSAVIVSLIIAVLVSIYSLRKLTCEHWYETYNLVLSLDRRSRQESNPNVKGVPLPNLPCEKPNAKPRQASYIELRRQPCTKTPCIKTHSVLEKVLNMLMQARGLDSQTTSFHNPSLEPELEEGDYEDDPTMLRETQKSETREDSV